MADEPSKHTGESSDTPSPGGHSEQTDSQSEKKLGEELQVSIGSNPEQPESHSAEPQGIPQIEELQSVPTEQTAFKENPESLPPIENPESRKALRQEEQQAGMVYPESGFQNNQESWVYRSESDANIPPVEQEQETERSGSLSDQGRQESPLSSSQLSETMMLPDPLELPDPLLLPEDAETPLENIDFEEDREDENQKEEERITSLLVEIDDIGIRDINDQEPDEEPTNKNTAMVNYAPVAVDDFGTLSENSIFAVDVVANDTDQNSNDQLTIQPGSVSIVYVSDSHGNPIYINTARVIQTGNRIEFDPGQDFDFLTVGETAQVQIMYAVQDNAMQPEADYGMLSLTITGVKETARAEDVELNSVDDHSAIVGAFSAVEAFDTNPYHYRVLRQPDEGHVTNNQDGTFSFEPGDDFRDLAEGETRQITFKYEAVDETGVPSAEPATVTLTVTGTNDRPVAEVVNVDPVSENSATVSGHFRVTDVDTTDRHSFNILSQPSQGTVTNHHDGTFSFAPGTDFTDLSFGETRQVTFTYEAIDDSGTANGRSAPATVVLTVTGTNDRPEAQVVAVTNAVEDDAAVMGSFRVNDVNVLDTHTFNILTQPPEGQVTNNDDGTFSFDPSDDFQDLGVGETRQVTFTYEAVDSTGADNAVSEPATITVTVTGTNDSPIASNLSVLLGAGSGFVEVGRFSARDLDLTDNVAFNILTQPSLGTVVKNSDNSFSFDGGNDFDDLAVGETRQVTFTYEAVDDSGTGNNTSEPATVTLTITGTNDKPTAEVVSVSANEDGATVTGSFSATDADTTDTHTFNILTQPTEGSVTNNDDGTFSFNPGSDFQDLAAGETRQVTFTYEAVDSSGEDNATSASATVTVTVTGTNDKPVAEVASASATEDGAAVTGSFSATDADTTDTHTFNILTQPTEGTVTNNDDGTFSFTPGSDFQNLAAGETRQVTFTYEAVDDSGTGNNTSEPATVTLTITGTNDKPTAEVVSVSATEDGAAVTGSFSATDADTTDTHTFNILTQPTEGTVTNNDDGTFSFNPGSDFQDLAAGETRQVTFTYEAVDDSGTGNNTSEPATVTLTITGTNDKPTAEVVSVSATEDGAAVTGSFSATDADTTDSHTFNILTQPTEGTVTNNDDGTFSFNPGSDFQNLAAGETRQITFTYEAVDDSGTGNNTSEPATVTLTITGTNDKPTAEVVSVSATEDGAAVTGSFSATDADTTDSHTFNILTQPSEGTVTNNDDGTFSFTPGSDFQNLAAGETRQVTFTYEAVDDSGTGNNTSEPATVTLTITGTNDKPTAEVVSVSATEDGAAVTGSFSATDADTTDSHTFNILTQPTEGTVTNNDDGTFSFNPGSDFQNLAAGETRQITFTYEAVDDSGTGNNTSEPATVTLTITGTNDKPTAEVVSVSATEGGAAVTGSFSATDADTTDTHTFNILTQPTEGTVTNNDDGTFSFNPGSDFQDLAAGETRQITFTYEAVDDSGTGNNTSEPATVTLTITGTNDKPTAEVVSVSATEDGAAVTGSFSATDADTTDTHTFNILTQPSEGTVTNNDDGTFSFNPGSDFQDLAAGETRQVTFTYEAVDDSGTGNNTSEPATVTLTITGTNDKPTAEVVSVSATEDGAAVTGSFSATDADTTDTHTFNILTQPTEGTVTNNDNGTFSFNPGSDFQDLAAGETRQVTFTYEAVDDSGTGNNTSEPATVTITVTGTNDAPVAVADTGSASTVGRTTLDVLDNDTDVDSDDNAANFSLDRVSITGISDNSGSRTDSGGTVSVENNQLVFDPAGDFDYLAIGESATVTVSYTMSDDAGVESTATATITVSGTNSQPVAELVSVSATEDGASAMGSFSATDANQSDTHTFNILTQPTEGTVTNNNDGTFSFNPGSDFQDLAVGETRQVTFTYEAVDSSGEDNATSASATVTVTVTGTNDKPTAEVVSVSATEDGAAVTGNFSATDADTTDTHTFNILTQPTEGTVTNNDDGTFSFNPGSDFQDLAAGETRQVTFTYEAVDDSGTGNNTSEPATVTLTITGTNDKPTAEVVSVSATEDGAAVTGSFSATDADTTDTHTFNILTQPTEGTVTNNDDGTFSFNPGSDFQDLAAGETRQVTFTYEAVDDSGTGNNTSEPATVTLTITGTNDKPTAEVVSVSATEDGAAVTGSFSATDADTTDTHTFNILTQPTEGTVTNNDDGSFSFNPGSDFQDLAAGETRQVTFTYEAVDDSSTGNNTSEPATVTLTITGTNDKPTAEVVSVSATEDGAAVTGSFSATDADTTDTHTFNILTQPTEGTVTNNDDGTFSFNPGSDFQDLAAGETRQVTFTYEAVDDSGTGNNTSEPATVTLTITGTNDKPTAEVVSVSATEDGAAVTGSFSATDADTTDTHTFNILTQPTEGTVTNNDDGTFSFNPGSDFQDLAAGETRQVTFTYEAVDDPVPAITPVNRPQSLP